MHSVKDILKLLVYSTKLTMTYSSKSTYSLFFVYYILMKIDALLKMKLKIYCIPDEVFSSLVMKNLNCSELYVDDNLYILCNSKFAIKNNNWFYLCCKSSKKKYKIVVIFTSDIQDNSVYMSESMKMNVDKKLNLIDLKSSYNSYFIVPVYNNTISYATEAKISVITNPHDYTNDLMNNLLKNFFSTPKYLRINDIFKINIKNYIPESKYCTAEYKLDRLYFKVNDIKTENKQVSKNGSFIVYGHTTLIEEPNVNSYIPCKCSCDILLKEKNFISNWPPVLNDLLDELQSCIVPFLQKDIYIDVKPIFLVEGSNGSGKYELIKTATESLGLNFLEADFAEVQSLTSAQTEAKLRIIIQDAENCTPCVLMLRNIQIFGINSEGQKDDRVLAAFATEVKKLYSKKFKYPVIIIATSTDSEISIDSERTFVEKITIGHLTQEQRSEILSWYINKKGLKHQADLQKIASMCSDFRLSDLKALVMHAMKNHFQVSEESDIELTTNDFIHACEYMQSIFSDEIGAPRVPKVYWDDIGGLADLKREIMRRIEMPLLNVSGLGKSGLLLYGPPGTGKTLLAKAVATECQLHFLSVKGPELLNMYVGQSEKNVRQVFERARAASPCIIFFDELDSLAPNRGQSGDSGGVMDRVVSQLLSEMDGLESAEGVFVIGATNRPDLIEPALLRPGRFDKMLYVGLYSEPEAQLGVFRALTRRFNLERSLDQLEPELLARLPRNLTGADLYSVCSNAWLGAVRRILADPQMSEVDKEKLEAKDVVVGLEDFERACKDLVPSVSEEELLRYQRLRNELSSR